jgi:hypothetical protein
VAEELQPDVQIAEKRNIGDQRDGMAFGLEQVQDLIDHLVEEGLAEDIEEDGSAEVEGVDLVEELSQPRFRKMLLRPAQDVGRAEHAVHVAVAREFEEERPGRIDRACNHGDGSHGFLLKASSRSATDDNLA